MVGEVALSGQYDSMGEMNTLLDSHEMDIKASSIIVCLRYMGMAKMIQLFLHMVIYMSEKEQQSWWPQLFGWLNVHV